MRVISTMSLALLAGIAAAPALGEDQGWQWYLGAGIPVTNIESSGFIADAAAEGFTVADELADVTIGWQGTLGVMVSGHFGAEVRYSASGNARDEPTISNLSATPLRGSSKTDIDGITVYGIGRWPLTEHLDLLGKLGYTFQDLGLDVQFPTVFEPGVGLVGSGIDVSDDDDGFAAALGFRIRVNDHWAVVAEAEYLAVDFDGRLDEPIRGSMNLEYVF